MFYTLGHIFYLKLNDWLRYSYQIYYIKIGAMYKEVDNTLARTLVHILLINNGFGVCLG